MNIVGSLGNAQCYNVDVNTCIASEVALPSLRHEHRATILGRPRMTWKTPKIVEVPVGMEINMYACAARK